MTVQVQGQQSGPSIKVCAGPNAADDCTAITSTGAGSQTFTVFGTGFTGAGTLFGLSAGYGLTACVAPDTGSLDKDDFKTDCDSTGVFTENLKAGSQALTDLHVASAYVKGNICTQCPTFTVASAGTFKQDLTVTVPSTGVVIGGAIFEFAGFALGVNDTAYQALSIEQAVPVLDGLAASATVATSVTLSWTDPSACASASPACIYEFRYRGPDGEFPDNWTAASSSTGHTVASLESATTYEFQVRVLQGAVGSEDVLALGTVPGTTLNVPSPPTGLTATPNQEKTQYDLAWTAPAADTARAAPNGYRIEWSADGLAGWATLATKGSSATTHSDTGLTAGTDRWYRVVATSGAGDSDPSNIHPPPPPDLRVFLKPDQSTAADRSAEVAELEKAGTHYFTVEGVNWTNHFVGELGVLLTACFAPAGDAELNLFTDCDSDGLHSLVNAVARAGSQDLTRMHGTDSPALEGLKEVNRSWPTFTIEADGSFTHDMEIAVPAVGTIITAVTGPFNIVAMLAGMVELTTTITHEVAVAPIAGIAAVPTVEEVALSWTNESFCTAAAPACTYWVRHKKTADGDDSWSAWAHTGWTSGAPAHTVTGLDGSTGYDFEIERREGAVAVNQGSVSATTLRPPPLALTTDRMPSEADDSTTSAVNERVATLTVKLDEPAQSPVTVTLTVDPASTATVDTDFTLSPATITIAQGATSGTATVTVIDDELSEGTITVDGQTIATVGETIVINASADTTPRRTAALTLTIADDELA